MVKSIKGNFGLELQTAKIAVDSGEFYYTLRDNETYEAICIKVAEVCGTIGESFFSEEEIKNVMSVVEPQIESQSTKNINTTNNSRNIQEITPNVVKVGSVNRKVFIRGRTKTTRLKRQYCTVLLINQLFL